MTDWIKVTLDGVALIMSIGAVFIAVMRTRKTEVDDRFKTGSDRMDRHEHRIAKIENAVAALPGREELHLMELGLTRVQGQLERIEATMGANRDTMTSLNETIRRVEDYLLKRSDK